MRLPDDLPRHIREVREAATCLGKSRHNRATANRIVRETTKVKLQSYKCRFCGH